MTLTSAGVPIPHIIPTQDQTYTTLELLHFTLIRHNYAYILNTFVLYIFELCSMAYIFFYISLLSTNLMKTQRHISYSSSTHIFAQYTELPEAR